MNVLLIDECSLDEYFKFIKKKNLNTIYLNEVKKKKGRTLCKILNYLSLYY